MMNPEPLSVTLARMEQRPGATIGGGIEQIMVSREYRIDRSRPLHMSINRGEKVACNKHDRVPRRNSLMFAYHARAGAMVCADCLRAWMNGWLDRMED